MREKYLFRQITKNEIKTIFDLIQSRVEWMNEVGIKQWNCTDYADVYPLSHYEKCFERKEIFVLEEKSTKEIICVGVLKHYDERWENCSDDAFYLHHFASKVGEKGVGKIFLECAERYAKQYDKDYIRLDSAIDNETLTKYYSDLGYEAVGECVDGAYIGILRQKRI